MPKTAVDTLTPQQILEDIRTQATVPIWPHAAWAFGICRNAAYAAAARGEIETVAMGRLKRVVAGPLRRKLQIEAA